jgi:transposase InsO family protein
MDLVCDSGISHISHKFGGGKSCITPAACHSESQEAKAKVEEDGSNLLGSSLQTLGWLAFGVDDRPAGDNPPLASAGFRLFWRWKSRGRVGRPKIDIQIRQLIRQLSKNNPSWGVPRIKSELALLGYDIAESTVAKYMVKHPKPPSQTWRTFLKNHTADIVACDFFTAYTVTFRVYSVFVMLRHIDRQIVHFNVTTNPTTAWAVQQVREAFPFDSAPRYLLHDNGSVFSKRFQNTLKSIGIESVRTAYRSPWQNPYVERVQGTLRREALDHLIILNERHLRRVLSVFIETYYNRVRPHLSLNRNSPLPRKIDPPPNGKIVSTPILGGLHHRYRRVA